MIILKKILFFYKKKSLSFSLKINQGEKISIFGKNGAGKSTLIKIIGGFLSIHSGKIFINNINHTNSSPSMRPISILFQENNLFHHLNIKQNIVIGVNTKFKLKYEEEKKFKNIIHILNLQDYLYYFPEKLSVGQRQLVAIARIFMRKKPILLLDEPFSSIDFFTKNKIINLLIKYCKKNKITLLTVLHNFEEAKHITNRSLIIENGKIIWDGNTNQVKYEFKNKH